MSSQDFDALRTRIVTYLVSELDTDTMCVKSRHVADELDLSTKRVGAALASLETESLPIALERWGGETNGITWRVAAPDGVSVADVESAVASRPTSDSVRTDRGQNHACLPMDGSSG